MYQKATLVVCALLLFGLGVVPARASLQDGLVTYFKLDDGSGTAAADSSGNGHTCTLIGTNLAWVPGRDGGALLFGPPATGVISDANRLEFPTAGMSVTAGSVCVWAYMTDPQPGTNGRYIFGHDSASGTSFADRIQLYMQDGTNVSTKLNLGLGGSHAVVTAVRDLPVKEWFHLVLTWNNGTFFIYFDGAQIATGTYSSLTTLNSVANFGNDGCGAPYEAFCGMLDEARVYNRALTAAEVKTMYQLLPSSRILAKNPSPADKATEVPADSVLSWTASEFAATHDVYLAKSFADANNASRAKPAKVLVSQGQTATTYTPAPALDFGQTYYWRVDEVNKAPDNTIYKGNIWSFTVEPYGYPITSVTATASSAQLNAGPEKTIDGSGLTDDLHGTDGTTMWMSTGIGPNWIQYQFDKTYKVWDLKVWNSNQAMESFIGFGAKDVKIEYSTDGATWTALANVPQFARAPGMPGYAANTTVNFGGVLAKYVKLTINSNWGGMSNVTGLSEVRFSYVPVQARSPQPANAATGIGISTTLSWRPGREAASHKVFFGTDQAAVTNGTAPAKTVTNHAFDPGSLLYGTTYYWRVDEVNTVTYPGDVWSFATQAFAVVDDFESYNDTDNRIYETWIDGYTDKKSGSVVGYLQAPFAERTIVHGGKQSMPLEYNNVKTPFYSETTRDLGTAQDWTGNGATHMDLWFRGYPAGSVAANVANGALTLTGDGTDIWNNADDFSFAYKTLTGDGTIIARVVSLGTGTNTWAKGGVMIRGDLTAGATFVDMVLAANSDGTAGNGASFQYRLTAAGACANTDATAVIKPPYWVKLERKGSLLTGSVSADGKTWTQQGTPQAIAMANPVDIGICVTAHQAGEQRTMQFDSITTTGNVSSSWQGALINSTPHNDPAGLYAVIQDSSGKSKLSVNADPAAANASAWTQWTIPLSDLTAAGVKTTKIQKITIGVGDKTNPKAGGAGIVFIDDIGFGHPLP